MASFHSFHRAARRPKQTAGPFAWADDTMPTLVFGKTTNLPPPPLRPTTTIAHSREMGKGHHWLARIPSLASAAPAPAPAPGRCPEGHAPPPLRAARPWTLPFALLDSSAPPSSLPPSLRNPVDSTSASALDSADPDLSSSLEFLTERESEGARGGSRNLFASASSSLPGV